MGELGDRVQRAAVQHREPAPARKAKVCSRGAERESADVVIFLKAGQPGDIRLFGANVRDMKLGLPSAPSRFACDYRQRVSVAGKRRGDNLLLEFDACQ